MTSDSIYLVSDEGKLQRVEHRYYASEEILQKLIADYPELLAGEQYRKVLLQPIAGG